MGFKTELMALMLVIGTIGVSQAAPKAVKMWPSWLKPDVSSSSLKNGDNGGMNCAICTIVISLAEQTAQVNKEGIEDALERICHMLPSNYTKECLIGVKTLVPYLIKLMNEDANPDVVCHGLGICKGSCHLYPEPSGGLQLHVEKARKILHDAGLPTGFSLCDIPGFKAICEAINNFANDHEPIDDIDGDGFSPLHTLRGADWRGKDCDDFNADAHPGALPVNNDKDRDSNCNGIVGVDSDTGKTYEELLCSGTQQMGTIVLGDSASAHFHVPPEYFEPGVWTNDTFDRLLFALENEFDWPMLSASTAFSNTSDFSPDIKGPVNSTYEILFGRNRCNHRDFQNIAVNGARSGSMNSTIQASMSRIRDRDQPALVLYALIGNDVCNGHEDTLSHMTTPQEMRDNALDTLRYLDTKLPSGSHVMMMGLADGRILYEALHNRTHPIGMLNNDVTYAALYDYLNCLSISPCRGWMNSNETLRNLTTQRAQNLSAVLEDIANTQNYTTFDLHYLPNPILAAIKEWNAGGGQTWQLIEPVDGFHPNQFAQPLIVDQVFKYIAANYPNILPPVNPNNDKIVNLFGDQGGY